MRIIIMLMMKKIKNLMTQKYKRIIRKMELKKKRKKKMMMMN